MEKALVWNFVVASSCLRLLSTITGGQLSSGTFTEAMCTWYLLRFRLTGCIKPFYALEPWKAAVARQSSVRSLKNCDQHGLCRLYGVVLKVDMAQGSITKQGNVCAKRVGRAVRVATRSDVRGGVAANAGYRIPATAVSYARVLCHTEQAR